MDPSLTQGLAGLLQQGWESTKDPEAGEYRVEAERKGPKMVGREVERTEDVGEESIGAVGIEVEQREGKESMRRRAAEVVGEEAGRKGASEEPEEEPEGLETAPLPVGVTIAAPVGRWRMPRLRTQGLEAEDSVDAEDQGELA